MNEITSAFIQKESAMPTPDNTVESSQAEPIVEQEKTAKQKEFEVLQALEKQIIQDLQELNRLYLPLLSSDHIEISTAEQGFARMRNIASEQQWWQEGEQVENSILRFQEITNELCHIQQVCKKAATEVEGSSTITPESIVALKNIQPRLHETATQLHQFSEDFTHNSGLDSLGASFRIAAASLESLSKTIKSMYDKFEILAQECDKYEQAVESQNNN